ncbi:MAG: hypothetical protein PHD65_12195 [Gallionella sp.]|nr:hypothetical protein [Gallionella sp.]
MASCFDSGANLSGDLRHRDCAPLFRDCATGCRVVSVLRHHDENGNAQTLAYAVMPDRLHRLFALEEELSLSRLLAPLKSYTSKRSGGSPHSARDILNG